MNEYVTIRLWNPPKWIDNKLQSYACVLFSIELVLSIFNHNIFYVFLGSLFANLLGGFHIYLKYRKSLPKKGQNITVGTSGQTAKVMIVTRKKYETTVTVNPNKQN